MSKEKFMFLFLKVGDEVVTEGLAKDLEAFYNKTESSDDRTKALDLLTSLRLGEERKQEPCPRPQTAMPAVGEFCLVITDIFLFLFFKMSVVVVFMLIHTTKSKAM